MGKKARKKRQKLIIAFKIEDESGNDITPDVKNTIYAYFGENLEEGRF